MSHFDDQVDSATELFLNVALANRKSVIIHNGNCYNCDEPIDKGVYCSPECREDAEKRERLKT